jgi:hypothetical protein
MASTSIDFTTYTEYVINLSAHAGSSIYMAFVRNEAPADGWYLYVDDIEVELIPPQPTLTLSYSSLSFFPITLGNTATSDAFTVGTNSGAAALAIDSVKITNSDYTATMTATTRSDTIAAGGDVDMDLSWTPSTFGLTSADVIITIMPPPARIRLSYRAKRVTNTQILTTKHFQRVGETLIMILPAIMKRRIILREKVGIFIRHTVPAMVVIMLGHILMSMVLMTG